MLTCVYICVSVAAMYIDAVRDNKEKEDNIVGIGGSADVFAIAASGGEHAVTAEAVLFEVYHSYMIHI